MARKQKSIALPPIEKDVHKLTPSEVFDLLKTTKSGLTSEEATARISTYGRNVLQVKKGKPLIVKFLSNFTHLMAILLWVGGAVGFIAQMPQLGIAVWMVNIINGSFSFFQEFRAEKATAALQKLLPFYATVTRNGEQTRVLADELVPGDIILLTEGDRISADARLVEENDLRIDQSTLTGESYPVRKTKDSVLRSDLTHTEEPNLVFAGTNVASGSGVAIVFATGMGTEFGKIAGLTQNQKEEQSPLQKELGRLTKMITFMAVSIGAFFFVTAILVAGVTVAESFIFALGMIVAFVPEGLLPTVTLALALGVQRMAKRNALVKRLSAVETLGCTTVICTDKTGTLTQNEMTISDLWLAEAQLKVTGVGYAPTGEILNDKNPISVDDNDDLRQLLVSACLCNNSRLVAPDQESPRWSILGDPTEAAMMVTARKAGLDLEEEMHRFPRVRELPFESRRKRMSTIHQITDHNSPYFRVAYVKGAPKEVLDLCTKVRRNGKDEPMDDALRAQIMAANDSYARNGLRVLAVSVRYFTKEDGVPANSSAYTVDLVEQKLTFLGLIAMMDPPRPEVADAVIKCRHSGIRIIMITGDYGLTAESIARRIGIIQGDHARIITGAELEKIDEKALEEALVGEVVFARVAPEQKLRVVTALQAMGQVVAVTGDGVNDAPALKKADIGIAMGIAGTDVAKEAADMILTDDNFASIVNAVEEGRAVYNNIRRFTTYIFCSNVPEAVPFVFFLFSHGTIPLPLTVMQILTIDLGTDMIPAIGLGAESPEAGIMDRPPRSSKEPLVTLKIAIKAFLWYGMLEAGAAMISYFYINYLYGWPNVPLASDGVVYHMATTMTLAAIVFCQIGIVFNCRTDRLSVFKVGLLKNKIVLIGIASELILLAVLVYVPFMQEIFATAPLGLREVAFLLIWPPIMFLLEEVRKALVRAKQKRLLHNKLTLVKGDCK